MRADHVLWPFWSRTILRAILKDVSCGIIMVLCEARSYFCDVALVPLALCTAQFFLSVMEIQGGPSSSRASVVPSSEILSRHGASGCGGTIGFLF